MLLAENRQHWKAGRGLKTRLIKRDFNYIPWLDIVHNTTFNVQSLIPESLKPSCLHATLASLVDQESSQTVPQTLLLQTSTRPSRLFAPSLSLIAPCVQAIRELKSKELTSISQYILVVAGWHLTPASSEWPQLCTPTPLLVQSQSLGSNPVHATLSKRMGPVPWPNPAKLTATAPT